MWNAVVSSRFRLSSRGVSLKDCLVSSKFLSWSDKDVVSVSDAVVIWKEKQTKHFCSKKQKKNIRLSVVLPYTHLVMEMDCLSWNQAPLPQTSLGSEPEASK